jgi:hypothetical protein
MRKEFDVTHWVNPKSVWREYESRNISDSHP